ncbi:MAG: DUF885 family protein [Candidatus Nanopelagicaceae bacterium]
MSVQEEIAKLGQDFWQWRTLQQPRSHDDIPRIERPRGWTPQWSKDDVARYRQDVASFLSRFKSIDAGSATKPTVSIESYVEYRLIGSAIHRALWELDHLKIWQEQPRFYIDQSIGVLFDHLLPLEITESALREVSLILHETPRILADGQANLEGHAIKAYAEVAIELLHDIENQVREVVTHLKPKAGPSLAEELASRSEKAIEAFVAYRSWLLSKKESMAPIKAIGREMYQWFFDNIALVPYSPEEMRAVGFIEWERAVTLESLSRNKHRNQPVTPLPKSAEEQVANEKRAEASVREFYVGEGILSQPDTLKHYLNAPIPPYLVPIRWLGVTDDLTGPSRVDENGYSYVPTPHLELPYFYIANARDTRAGIVHEGAHYQQLAISWRHSRPLRRHYYDSGSNEGIAFYNEELMLAAGLFDDAPHSQTLMYNFMKLRAMRVIVDVNLAIGEIDIPTATAYLEKKVPMDHGTAYDEAVFFASSPGQALTYQIGKTQIIKFYSDAIEKMREKFNIQAFHDYLWLNGNVPISLQRLEYLGDASDLIAIDERRARAGSGSKGNQ